MEKDWWKGKSLIRIYPKSFKAAMEMGVGDLKGDHGETRLPSTIRD